APPTVVTVTLIASGKERAVPLTFVSETTGMVRSTLMTRGPVVPVLPAASDCVTVTVYEPSAEGAVVGVYDQRPAVQFAAPLCVLVPVIETESVDESPIAPPHVPPNTVTVALLR